MSVATFDNPATMARELWQDGNFLGHTTAAQLCIKGFRGFSDCHFGFNVGPWKEGQIVGDEQAIDPSARSRA